MVPLASPLAKEPPMRTAALAAALFSLCAFAGDELDPQTIAKIRSEQKEARAEVDKKYGNKKPGELSSAERKQMAKEKNEAELKVLEKNRVEPKDYARAEAKLGKDDRAAADAEEKRLEKEKEGAKAADGKKKDGKKEVVVEKGGKGAAAAGTPEGDAAEAAQMDREAGLGKGK